MSLLVVGVGGLGRQMVHEALGRGLRVSVLVRDPSKLEAGLDADTPAQLAGVTVGDATDPSTLDEAMSATDVALSGRGAHQRMARELAKAVRRNGLSKLCWPAGGSNVMSEDGVTPAYLQMLARWPAGGDVYRAHQACIDASAPRASTTSSCAQAAWSRSAE